MSKTALKPGDHPNTGRRSFMWKAGAAMSAVLAAAVPAISMPKFTGEKGLKGEVDRLTGRLASLEDEGKIRELNQTLESRLNNGNYESIVELFSSDAEVIYNGGVFKGKETGVRRLFCKYFSSGQTGKKIMPEPGFDINSEQLQDKVEISGDCRTAKAQFTYSMQAGIPIVSDSVLLKMARLQGGGIMKWWESGICSISCIKDMKAGNWKIKKLEYQSLSKAEYKPGRSYSRPVELPLFSKVYPYDPEGPDRLC